MNTYPTIMCILFVCWAPIACSKAPPSTSPDSHSAMSDGDEALLDQDCYQQCLAKGESEDLCNFFCTKEGDGGKPEGSVESGGQSSRPLDLVVEGETRQYRLFLPSMMQAPAPLIVFFHGGGGRDSAFPQQSRFETLAEERGIILAYAMGESRRGEEADWLLNTTPHRQQDIRYIETLIDTLSASHSVDQDRIYAIGYSLGSMYTYEVACHLSHRFAAVASHAGSMPVAPSACQAERPIAIMHIHGVDDEIIPYGERWTWKEWDQVGEMRDIPSLIQHWSERYQCRAPEASPRSGSAHLVHDQCERDVRVEHHRLAQVGHEWPDQINGASTHAVMWLFLSEFTL